MTWPGKITSILQLPAEERAAMGAASRAMVEEPRHRKHTLDTFEALYRGDSYEDHAIQPAVTLGWHGHVFPDVTARGYSSAG